MANDELQVAEGLKVGIRKRRLALGAPFELHEMLRRVEADAFVEGFRVAMHVLMYKHLSITIDETALREIALELYPNWDEPPEPTKASLGGMKA